MEVLNTFTMKIKFKEIRLGQIFKLGEDYWFRIEKRHDDTSNVVRLYDGVHGLCCDTDEVEFYPNAVIALHGVKD